MINRLGMFRQVLDLCPEPERILLRPVIQHLFHPQTIIGFQTQAGGCSVLPLINLEITKAQRLGRAAPLQRQTATVVLHRIACPTDLNDAVRLTQRDILPRNIGRVLAIGDTTPRRLHGRFFRGRNQQAVHLTVFCDVPGHTHIA